MPTQLSEEKNSLFNRGCWDNWIAKKTEKKREETKEIYIVSKVKWFATSDTAEEDGMLRTGKYSLHLVM